MDVMGLMVVGEAAQAVGAPEMVAFWSAQGLIALVTLATLEIVLGIDNIVFISILTDKLPEEQRAKTRNFGILLAMVMRIGLLFAAAWVVTLDKTVLFTVFEKSITPKSLVLLLGGLFLIAKATWEIHHQVEGHGGKDGGGGATKTVGFVLAQIIALDLVFSIDSVITAVGMVSNLWIMVTAVMSAVVVMLIAAGPVSDFVQKHPSIKLLALAFLVLIGVLIIAEGLHVEQFERGYVYFAMAFALGVELLNIRADKKRKAARGDG